MKPRTKIEVAVVDAAKYLPKLAQTQIDFAYDQFFPKLCFRSTHKAFCLECGEGIPVENISRNKVICEGCGSKLQVETTRKRSHSVRCREFALADIFYYQGYEFQIIRLFQISVKYFRGINKEIFCEEVTQRWSHDKKTVIRSQLMNSWSNTYRGMLEIRKPNHYKKYGIYPSFYLKESVFLEKYTKKGINAENLGYLNFETIATAIQHSPKVETLLKARYYNVLGHFNFNDIDRYWGALKICIRNNYKIEDGSMYKDALGFLQKAGKDLLNAHYVCPKNLKETHDIYMNIQRQKEIQQQLEISKNKELQEKRDKEFLKNKSRYVSEKKKFLDLQFKQGNIVIEPLKSVDEFKKEGIELHHCVYRSRYYAKEKSLLFSAKVDGKRTETIEIDLDEFQVKQCRGYSNKDSEHHDQIFNLIQKNINKIKKVAFS